MSDRERLDARARAFFEKLWAADDPWELEQSAFEQRRYARLLATLEDRRYARVLEIGCGAGAFTRRLARLAGHVVALDISSTAIARAAARLEGDRVDFRAANVMEVDLRADGPWDCVVLSETVYYLGWLYSVFDVGWLALRLLEATADGGRLLLANSQGGIDEPLMRPWLVRTYRDLFANVGWELEREETFCDLKHGVQFEVLISLFGKPARSESIDGPSGG